ncbi:MAG: SDR family NAD(P)-dependent oxidoreductase [Pseudomonadota bacterium]
MGGSATAKATYMMSSLPNPFRAAIVGASGGIGHALVTQLASFDACGRVYALSRKPDANAPADKVVPLRLDYDDPASISTAATTIEADGPLHLTIVATGLLHDGETVAPEKDWRHLNADTMGRVFHVNTIGPSLVAQAFLPLFPKDQHGVFAALAARVGSITDNGIGGWYSYRASKAALVMIIKSLAIELQRKKRQTVIVGLHPGTVDTGLSQPFQANTRPGQVVAPDQAARDLLSVINSLDHSKSGLHFAYDGASIAP